MGELIGGLVLFLGVHSVAIVAPSWRDSMRQMLGWNIWRALYSIASLAGFVLLILGYAAARSSPTIVYTSPFWLRHVVLLLMLPVFPLLFAAYLPGRIKAVTKHPMLTAVKLWAFAHLLANGSLHDVVLFGSFLAWAVLDRISLKHRPPQAAKTLPASRWNDAIAIVLGLAAYVAMVLWLHLRWIGVSPLG
jgi:uncharacterized membrane protein